MWVFCEPKKYFFKFDFNVSDDVGTFFYTDLNCMFVEEKVTKEILIRRTKELNKRYGDFALDMILMNLKTAPEESTLKQVEEKKWILDTKYYIDKNPFKFVWELKTCKENEFQNLLINPLLLALISLKNQNEELLETVEKKDKEIEQYRIEGAVLKRRLVATNKFSKNTFYRKHPQVDIEEFISYGGKNLKTLKETCQDFIKTIELEEQQLCDDESVDNNNLHEKLLKANIKTPEKSKIKRLRNMQRRQLSQKIKGLGKPIAYLEEECDTSIREPSTP